MSDDKPRCVIPECGDLAIDADYPFCLDHAADVIQAVVRSITLFDVASPPKKE